MTFSIVARDAQSGALAAAAASSLASCACLRSYLFADCTTCSSGVNFFFLGGHGLAGRVGLAFRRGDGGDEIGRGEGGEAGEGIEGQRVIVHGQEHDRAGGFCESGGK